MKFSKHFINDVQPKRPYITTELLEFIISNPVKKVLI